MRAVVQRVRRAEVRVAGRIVGRIGSGLLVMAAVGTTDTREAAAAVANKILHLRIFDNEHGKMDRSVTEAGGDILCVSEFTLSGDCRRGRRPRQRCRRSPVAGHPAETRTPIVRDLDV